MQSKNYIKIGENIRAGEYLVSENGVFFARMQYDGNFVVYRGSSQDSVMALWSAQKWESGSKNFHARVQEDGHFVVYRGTPENPKEAFWATGKYGDKNKYYAIMQNDGNFVVYPGIDPDNKRGAAYWASGIMDSVDKVESIISLDYDTTKSKIIDLGSAEVYKQEINNNGSSKQTTEISETVAVSVTKGWSNTFGVKVSVEAGGEAGIPFVAKGQVKVTGEVSNAFTMSKSETTTRSFTFKNPVTIPPNTKMVCLATVRKSTLSVPYEMKATVRLKSGYTLPAVIKGDYVANDAHDLKVSFDEVKQ